MAHLWFQDLPNEWAVIPLETPRAELASLLVTAHGDVPTGDARDGSADAVFLQHGTGNQRAWHLLAAPDAEVWVNGLPVLAGLRVLADRDEIRIDGRDTFFFSTEELARVTPMPVTDKPVMCPRCRQRIEPDTLGVRCPQCGLWHHQSDDLPCWTYAPTCALCPQPSALDAGFRWTPMEL